MISLLKPRDKRLTERYLRLDKWHREHFVENELRAGRAELISRIMVQLRFEGLEMEAALLERAYNSYYSYADMRSDIKNLSWTTSSYAR